MARYIFITGGVVSSLGKGLMAASLAALLQARGYKVRIRKFDPYLNVDPGTMSPYQHGEVFVTDDGAETDLDLGHYERFTGVSAHQGDNITSGRIYQSNHRQGTPRRLSGRDRAGDPARNRRDQAVRAGRYRGAGFRAVRIRRHRRRYRGAALHRGDSPAAQRTAARADGRDPRYAGALYQGGGRAEDKADPALGPRTDQPWRAARYVAVPLRTSAARQRAPQDRAVLQCADRGGHPRARRQQHLCRAAAVSCRGSGRGSPAPFPHGRARTRVVDVARYRRPLRAIRRAR